MAYSLSIILSLSCVLLLQSSLPAESFVCLSHATMKASSHITVRAPPVALQAETLQDSIFDALAQQPSLVLSDALVIVKNIAVAVGGIIAVLAAVAIIFSTFIIPKAAEQLEKEAKSLDPALWESYESKLEPGEVLSMRPDLIQELGIKIREKSIAKFAQSQKEAAAVAAKQSELESIATSGVSSSSSSDVVDVEFVQEEKKDS